MPTMVNKTLSSLAGLTSLGAAGHRCGLQGAARRSTGSLTAVATVTKLISLLPAIFLPMAVHFGFTDQKLVALLVMLGSVTTRRATLWPKQMGHEGTLTGSVCVTTTFFQRPDPDLLGASGQKQWSLLYKEKIRERGVRVDAALL